MSLKPPKSQVSASNSNSVPTPNAMEHPFTVMTYNVNFALGTEGLMEVAECIQKHRPDVVCLQETNETWQQILEARFQKTYYPYQLWRHCDNGWYAGGMGVLSKLPVTELHWLPALSRWFNAWILQVQVTDTHAVQIVNLHLRPSLHANSFVPSLYTLFVTSVADRLRDIQHWFESVKQDMPTVVLGDFNESTSGLYKGKVCHWLENSCEISFRNAVLQHNSEPPHTWEWQLPIIKLRAHFDHIFYSKERLVCVAADVVPVYNASDHHPVVAQLAFPVPDSNT